MSPRELVENAVERELSHLPDLPRHIKPVVERHCLHLIELATTLEAAGKSRDAIHILVENLLKSYSLDLVNALEQQP